MGDEDQNDQPQLLADRLAITETGRPRSMSSRTRRWAWGVGASASSSASSGLAGTRFCLLQELVLLDPRVLVGPKPVQQPAPLPVALGDVDTVFSDAAATEQGFEVVIFNDQVQDATKLLGMLDQLSPVAKIARG